MEKNLLFAFQYKSEIFQNYVDSFYQKHTNKKKRLCLSHFLSIVSLGIPCYKMNHDVDGELVAPMEMVDSWQRCGEFLLLHQQRTALYVLYFNDIVIVVFRWKLWCYIGMR